MKLSNYSCRCDPWQLAAKCVRASFAMHNSNTLICGRSSMSSQGAVVSEFVAPHPSRLASEYIVVSGGGYMDKMVGTRYVSVPPLNLHGRQGGGGGGGGG